MTITRERLDIVSARRNALNAHFDVKARFEEIEETCVPSYVHPNKAAAGTAWLRLMTAAELFARHAPTPDAGAPLQILDFGAGSGELYHMLGGPADYRVIEEDPVMVETIRHFIPDTKFETLDSVKPGSIDVIFAMDSLEHNENVGELLGHLRGMLRPGGLFILSGPTENWLYRLGRKIAGFDGHYHMTTIIDIERMVEGAFVRCAQKRVPFGVPLFHVSAWMRPKGG